jgi:TetR/AcrR family transcriptional regulator, regulator of cefoperazone and chloramphenicol sensitivity
MSGTHADRETRERLLQAAERLFAKRGFKAVTVREICHAARANVAAVNYHFGDKLGLYREVMRIASRAMRDATEAARAAGEGKPADEQLRVYVAIFLRRLLTPGSESIHQLINREISDPTPALDDLVEEGVRPRIDYLSGVVGRLIGCAPTDQRVLRCVVSVQAQSVMFGRPNPVTERLGFASTFTPAQIDEAARHIAEFSLAGIRAVARLAPHPAPHPEPGAPHPEQHPAP